MAELDEELDMMQNAHIPSTSCCRLDPGLMSMRSIFARRRRLCEVSCLLVVSKSGGASSSCEMRLCRRRDTASTLAAVRTDPPRLSSLATHL